MGLSIQEFNNWLERAKELKATHLIVVCDTFDYEDYPVYCYGEEDFKAKRKEYTNASMQRIMEVVNI